VTTLTRRWFPRRMPDDTRVRQVYGFCFDDAGRVLLGEEGGEGTECRLPGGMPEQDGFDCLAALIRECRREYWVSISRPIYLGYWQVRGESPELPDVELFLAARITTFHRTGVVSEINRPFGRLLTPIREVSDRLGWSEDGPVQEAGAVASTVFGLNPPAGQQAVRRA
jgi:hypothetical protein